MLHLRRGREARERRGRSRGTQLSLSTTPEEATFAGFELPDELRMLADAISDFVTNEIRAVESDLDPASREMPADLLRPLQAKAREAGFWCFDAPTEHGGGGLSAFQMATVHEK